jgi:hypothetical protein
MRPAATVRARHRMRAGPLALAALVVPAVAVLLAGCGGVSSLRVDSISGSTKSGSHRPSSKPSGGVVRFFGVAPSPAQRASAQVAGLLFSRCMRSHGVPDFPDPSGSGGGIGLAFGGGGIDPAAPLFRVAQRTCISFLTRRGGPLR